MGQIHLKGSTLEKADIIESLTGVNEERKKSRIPAKLDFYQSATGLFLALFICAHILFESSILFGKDTMYAVTKMFEGQFLFGEGKPIIISILAIFIFIIFILHAALAMRKFPINYRQYKMFKTNMNLMGHDDTKLWFIQAYTGFFMFFLGSVHLYIMIVYAGKIGPYASSDRVTSDWFWPLYFLLLTAVVFHAMIGLYRLCLKWGWFDGDNPRQTRVKLKKAKTIFITLYLLIGLLSLATYIKIGIAHKTNYGQRYTPVSSIFIYHNQHRKVA